MIDRVIHIFSWSLAILFLLTVVSIVGTLFMGSLTSIKEFGLGFLASTSWNPATRDFGAIVPIVGTLATAFLSLMMALPISFGISYFVTEILKSDIKFPLIVLIELLAVIPSIIYGMWGLFVFIPFLGIDISTWLANHLANQFVIGQFFHGPSSGISILTASVILAIMIIPFITVTFKDAFELVPRRVKESAYSLGCTSWEVIWNIIVPYTRVQIIGGMMLGLTRTLGETMAVAFVIGNAYNVTTSILQPGTTIASSLANEFTEAESELYSSSLIQIGLLLFVITFIVSTLASMLLKRLNKKSGA